MKKNSRILIVVDPTKGSDQTSVLRGQWLAEALGLNAELLICFYNQFLTGDHFFDNPTLKRAREEVVARNHDNLEKIAESMRNNGIDVTVSSIWDTPLDEGIIRHVLRTEPEYVIKETHYHSSVQRALFTNTDWNLVRQCPAPLWLAKGEDWPEDATILASLDPTHENDEYSEMDRQILNHVTTIADKTIYTAHAFNSFMPITSIPLMQADPRLSEDGAAICRELKADHQMRLNMQLKYYSIPSENVHLEQGYPERLLPQLATELKAGLVVMGSIARNPFGRVFIGSTTEKVLSKLPCDLLVVKPEWFVTQVEAEGNDFIEAT